MESHENLLTTVFLVAIWLLLALKVFRFDKLASTMFNGTFVVVIVSGMLVFAFAVVFGLIAAAAQWATGDDQVSRYVAIAGAAIIVLVFGLSWASEKLRITSWDDLRLDLEYLIKTEIPEQIKKIFNIKIDRDSELSNSSLVLKLAKSIANEEKSSVWHYFLATVFFGATYFIAMDGWKNMPLLIALYTLFMVFYRWVYRARFIKTSFAKIVVLLEVLERNGQYMVFYDDEDGEYYGICCLEEKPARYPNTPWNERFVDIGDGELGYLLSSTMDYVDFRRAYLNIRNVGVKRYLHQIQKKDANA